MWWFVTNALVKSVEMTTVLDAINEHNEKRARLKFETSKIARPEMAPPELSPSVGKLLINCCSKLKYNLFFLPSSYNSRISANLGEF